MEQTSFEAGDHYQNALGVFLEKCDEVAKDKEVLALHLPVAVRKILQDNQLRDTFNVLSVGCGDGTFDRYILELIHKELQRHKNFKDTKIFNRAIDINGQVISLYQQDIQRSDDEKTVFDVRQMSWEEYVKERSLNKDVQNRRKFDIVHFIHSFYYFDIQESLDHCFENELKENGRVICITSDFTTYDIIAKLDKLKRYGKATVDDCYQEMIKRLAQKREWNVDHYTQEHFVDVTEIFDENSFKGNLLLDFLTKTENFRATTDKEKVEEVLQMMREKSTVKDGKILSNKIDDLLFIFRGN